MMILPDRIYDLMKWLTLVVIPALTTAYVGLSGVWGWPYGRRNTGEGTGNREQGTGATAH